MLNKKERQYTNKEVVQSLDKLNKTLKGDVKIVTQTKFKHYVVALSFLIGVSTFAFGLALHNNWNLLISMGVSLIALGFFIMWVIGEGN